MAIDLSAFKNRLVNVGKKQIRDIDLGAFGYEWADDTDIGKPLADTTVATPAPKPRQTLDEAQAIVTRDRERGVTISAPPKEKFGLKTIGSFLKVLLPDPVEDALFGDDTANRFAEKPTGALNFFYGGLLKTDQQKYDKRVERLVNEGIDEERAGEIAWKSVLGEEVYATPKEEAVLRKTAFLETGEKFLDSLDFVPFVGGLAKNTLKLSFKTLAKLSDEMKIADELMKSLPKMDAETRVSIAQKIAKTTDENEVAKIVAQGVKDSAAKMDNAVPYVRKTETDEVLPMNEIAQDVAKTRSASTAAKETVKDTRRSAPRMEPDEVEDLRDMVKKDQATLRPTRANGKVDETTPRNLKAEIAANVTKYSNKMADADIAKRREEMLLEPETLDEIVLRKRGIIGDEEALERASKIRGTLEDVINLPKGSTATVEQFKAIEQLVQSEREINKALRNLIENGGAASSRTEREALARLGNDVSELPEGELLTRALQESTLKLKKAEVTLLGIRAETGRTLGSMRSVADAVDSRLRTLYSRINNNKKLSELEKQSMVDFITKLDTSDNKKFLETLDKIASPDIFDKVAEWSVAAKLWNPTTHIVNLGGNTIRQAVDIGLSTLTNPMAARADIAGATTGLKQGLKTALRALTDDGYAAQLAKYIETGGNAPAIGGKLGKWVRTPFRALGASDEIFKAIGYQRKMYRDAYGIAKREGLKGKALQDRMQEILNAPTFKMMEDATNEAKHLTFQDDMGEITAAIDNLRNPTTKKTWGGKTGAVIARAFLPFLKTPTNLFKQSVDFSPLGTIKNFKKLKEARKAGDMETIGKVVGESLLGTAIMAYIASEAMEGNVTGGAPKNKGDADRFYREKKLPYAIKVGDKWYQYKRIDPFATLMGLTADIINNDAYEDGKYVSSTVGIIANNLKDKTYLSGVSDLVNLLAGEEWEREQAINSMLLGAAMPSIIGHTARSIDPTIRETDGMVDRIKSQIPGVSQTLPAKIDVLGYESERANKGLNYFFNPIQSETAEIDPVTLNLLKLDKTISTPNNYFTREGVKYQLTPEEYEDFARDSGKKLRRGLMELFKSTQYKVADDERKEKLIDDLRKEVQDEWKDGYVERQGSRKSLDSIFGNNQRRSLGDIFGN